MKRRSILFLVTAPLVFCLLTVSQAAAQNPVPFKLTGTATWDNLMNAIPPNDGMRFADGAVTILRDLVAEPKQLSDAIISKLRSDDDFRSLRADEAFIGLLAKLPTESDINSKTGVPNEN